MSQTFFGNVGMPATADGYQAQSPFDTPALSGASSLVDQQNARNHAMDVSDELTVGQVTNPLASLNASDAAATLTDLANPWTPASSGQ